MKRLLIVNDFDRGGGAERVFHKTREIFSKIYAVETFVGAERHVRADAPLSHIYSKGRQSSFARIYSLRNGARFLGVLNGFRPDVVHLHNYYNALSPSVLAAVRAYRRRGNRTRVVFTAHDFHLLCPYSDFVRYSYFSNRRHRLERPPGLCGALFHKWDERGFPFSLAKKAQWVHAYGARGLDGELDAIIAPSDFLAGLFRMKYRDVPVYVVRNPLAMESPIDDSRPPRAHDPADGTLKMLFAGRLSPEKGLAEFIGSLGAMEGVDFRFRIVGRGPSMEAISRIVAGLRLGDRVTLAGEMEHAGVLDEMKRSDAVVLPSTCYENAPLSLLEGARMGLRLITSSHGGMKEVGELCGGAYFMDPLDPQSVRDAVKRCFDDRVSDRRMEGRDARLLERAFSDERYRDELGAVYEGLSAA